MAWICVMPGAGLPDVSKDRKSAVRFEKYLLSENALYFEGKYLPLDRIRDVKAVDSMYFPRACCGGGIPVTKIRVDYGGPSPVVLMMERKEKAEQLLQKLSCR